MRLTLRTLLAHEHGLLNEQQAELISQKIQQSPFVAQLLRHLKDRAARREIVPLAIEARGTAALEKVTQYLDYTLSAEEVVKLENECFASDRLLAEVASCHEIVSQWLSTPTPTEPALRQRLYAIMPGPVGVASIAEDEIAIELPALTYQSAPPSQPLAEKDHAAKPEPAKSRWMAGAFRLVAMAASVLAIATLVTMNRDQVESMIAQHWQEKTQEAPLSHDIPAAPKQPIAPEALVAQASPMRPIAAAQPGEMPPAPLPEVATTAFHIPIPTNQSVSTVDAWSVVTAAGTLYQETPEANWQPVARETWGTGRVVVIPGGALQVDRAGTKLELRQLSDLSLENDGSATLRYGGLTIEIEPNQQFMIDVAGQPITISALHETVRLAMSTRATALRGLDLAASAANQEVQFEGIAGQAELTIPGCRGPVPLEQGQMIVSHVNHGVRGGKTSILPQMQSEATNSLLAEALQDANEPARFLQESLPSKRFDQRLAAATALAQLGQVTAWIDAWSQVHDPSAAEQHLKEVQELLAQDSTLATELRNALAQQNPENGPLIYRLICGFSPEQLTDETRSQLETLLRHSEPAVQSWTRFQLSQQ
ncbi:hypothetical protein AB1K70_12995 [Bremerella sp. JC770]|uniref:hypothetical protein n=1 Tax=Bremerella sp. JC770 TaxID=3232137 RepID=UPI003458DE88